MKYSMQKIKEIVEPIFEKYGVKVMCGQLYYSICWNLNNSTVVWDGEVVPKKVKTIITYYEDGSLYIDGRCIPGNRLEKIKVDQMVRYIDSVIGLYVNSDEFWDKKELDYLVPNGRFICWKKCENEFSKPRIVKLEVPANAKRFQALNEKKFRVSEAKVLGIYDMGGSIVTGRIKKVDETEVRSLYDCSFKYKVGELVKPDEWDEYDIVCSNGIHAYMKVEDAINY